MRRTLVSTREAVSPITSLQFKYQSQRDDRDRALHLLGKVIRYQEGKVPKRAILSRPPIGWGLTTKI